jgi:dipeptidyl aminopeptidase/acylaminoacyl peptidase
MRLNKLLPAALLPLCALALLAQAPAKHGMTLDDLAKIQRVGAPVLSPDGAWIAYTVSHVDTGDDKSVNNLWMISWDGTQQIQLTYGKDGAGSPQWSPDGRYLAFTSGREGEAKGSQVWVLDRRGGEAHQITDVKMSLNGYKWSPDSKTLLLTLEEKEEPEPAPGAKPKAPKPIVIDRFHFKEDIQGYVTDKEPHLYLFDIATKKLSKLTDGPAAGKTAYGESQPAFSPDGTKVAFVSNQTLPDPDRFANSDIFVVDAKPGSHPKQLTTFTGRDGGPLEWTKDSKSILFREGVTPHYSIYDLEQMAMVSADGGPVKLLAPRYDHWVGAPVLTATGDAVLTEVQEDRQDFIASIALDGSGKVDRITQGSGAASGLDEKAGHTALLWSSDTAPSEIYALENGSLRPLTHYNDALVATLDLPTVTDLSAKTKDGNEAHGLFTLPVGYVAGTKVPMILRIHGGPTAQDAHGFNTDTQLFAAHGYAVLNVNYRGSTGRGEAYSFAINNDWGNKEVLDLLAMTDAAVATGKVDPNQLGVGGWSYGGILTDYTIASTTRFKAASSGAGMGNLLGFYGIDQYILQYENEIGPPWKALDQYVKMSYPFLHADRIKTPTLFMGGDKDFNVPLQGGEQMYQALKSVGTTAELIVYPGQFHGFTRPSYIRDRYDHWFEWYDLYVRGIQPKPKPDPKAEPKGDAKPDTKPATDDTKPATKPDEQ